MFCFENYQKHKYFFYVKAVGQFFDSAKYILYVTCNVENEFQKPYNKTT